MSDDRIIDFNDLKNKVKDSDVDKFEQYIYNLYFSVMDGSMTMAEFSRKIFDYMKDNNISQEKFMNIQKQRIEAFLHPDDPSYAGNYQVIQSLIAIGSGGFTGKGPYEGSQSQNDFLPVQDSDFIFAVIGEEQGFIVAGAVIILYVILITKAMYVAKTAKDEVGSNIAMGIAGIFLFHMLQNIGMTMGLLPITRSTTTIC